MRHGERSRAALGEGKEEARNCTKQNFTERAARVGAGVCYDCEGCGVLMGKAWSRNEDKVHHVMVERGIVRQLRHYLLRGPRGTIGQRARLRI